MSWCFSRAERLCNGFNNQFYEYGFDIIIILLLISYVSPVETSLQKVINFQLRKKPVHQILFVYGLTPPTVARTSTNTGRFTLPTHEEKVLSTFPLDVN